MARNNPRRGRLAIVLAAGTAMLAGVTAAVVIPLTQAGAATATGLARAAEAKGRYFGSASDNPELSDAPYVSILTAASSTR